MELLLAVISLGFQALFAGSETSLVRSNWIRVATWVRENRRWAKLARKIIDHKEQVLITTLVGTNLFILVTSSLAEHLIVHTLGPGYTFLPVVLVTFVSLFFAQILPKSAAQLAPERWLTRAAPLLRIAHWVFLPLDWLLGRISNVRPTSVQTLTRKDYMFALRERSRFGAASPRASGIAGRLLEFPGTRILDVMTPLARVVSVPEDITYDALRAVIRGHRFSRYPVYQGQPDKIVGVFHIRDLLQLPHRIIRKPFFVSGLSRALEVMNLMKDRGEHIALVHDARQRTVGIVTLEDLLEELVGEIRSEE